MMELINTEIEHLLKTDSAIYFGEINFDAESKEVWQIILSELRNNLQNFPDSIHPDYLHGFSGLKFNTHRLPELEEINQYLMAIGWKAVFVRGFVPAKRYVQLLANRIFPVSSHIRKKSFIEHSPSPDFIHDLFGHLPMLFCQEYREYIQRWAMMATLAEPTALDELLFEKNDALIKAKEFKFITSAEIEEAEQNLLKVHRQLKDSPTELSQLTKLYVWSNEYGILRNKDKIQIFGAAIMSSTAEVKSIVSGQTKLTEFSKDILQYDVDYTKVQPVLYPAYSFSDYTEILSILNSQKNSVNHESEPLSS